MSNDNDNSDYSDELIDGIRIKLKATRIMYYAQIANVLEGTFLFAIQLADHIGEISYSEAIEAVRIHFNEEIEREIKKEKIKNGE